MLSLVVGETVPTEEAEELRIVFVALTRAQRYCAVALPADTEAAVIEGFEAAGVALAPAAQRQRAGTTHAAAEDNARSACALQGQSYPCD